jgi:hypothetical protein
MYKYFILAGLIALSACHKTADAPAVTHPQMDYTEINQEISFGQAIYVDPDNNGSQDFLFYTIKTGDPGLAKEYYQYHFGSSYAASVAVDSLTDQTPALTKNAAISGTMPAGLQWYNASGVMMTRKVVSHTGAPSWEGPWANAHHQYLAIRILRAGLLYYGWLEVSFNTATEKTIVHRAAICRQADVEVKAGL